MQLLPMATTAKKLGLNDFLRAIESFDLLENNIKENFTLFGPQDGSFPLNTLDVTLQEAQYPLTGSKYRNILMVSNSLAAKMEEEMLEILLNHLLLEPRRISSFKDDEVLTTPSTYESTIRINFFFR